MSKRSEHKESHGGRKTALRAHKPTGTATEEIVYLDRAELFVALLRMYRRDVAQPA